MYRHHLTQLISLLACAVLAGCGGGPADDGEGPTPRPGAATPASGAVTPSLVARAPRTATPTVADPLAVAKSRAIAGVVVPAGAELVDATDADADADARADYRIDGVEAEGLSAWFAEHMPEAGWSAPEERDGALVFLHETELSARHASLGQKRTATVIFDLTDDVDFTLLVEAPK